MGILIDSSVLIAWERERLDLESQLAGCADEDFAISAITASELLHGVHRAANPGQRRRREAFVEGLLARLPVISFDAVAARIHARLSAELAVNGTAVGPARFHHRRHGVDEGLYRHHLRRARAFREFRGCRINAGNWIFARNGSSIGQNAGKTQGSARSAKMAEPKIVHG